MTQRAKPAAPRPRRSSSDRSSRRTLYLNIAFLLIILVGSATLIGAAIASYAGAHWAEVANVNGVSINRDQATAAADVDVFKLTYQISQLHDDLSAGRISQADFDSQNSNLTQAEQNVSSGVVDALVDDELQSQLAKQNGISVTDQQVDAQVLLDATEQESRHVLMIAVTPLPSGTTATDAGKAIARQTAEAADGQLRSGTRLRHCGQGVLDRLDRGRRRRHRLDPPGDRHPGPEPGQRDLCPAGQRRPDQHHHRHRRLVPDRPGRGQRTGHGRSQLPAADQGRRGEHGCLPGRDQGRAGRPGAGNEDHQRRHHGRLGPARGERDQDRHERLHRSRRPGPGAPHPVHPGQHRSEQQPARSRPTIPAGRLPSRRPS